MKVGHPGPLPPILTPSVRPTVDFGRGSEPILGSTVRASRLRPDRRAYPSARLEEVGPRSSPQGAFLVEPPPEVHNAIEGPQTRLRANGQWHELDRWG